MPENVSDEVLAMQRKERARWLIVGDAHRLREDWTKTRKALDELTEKLDADPDDQKLAELFILIGGLTVGTFMTQAHAATKKLSALYAEGGADA